MSIVLIPNQPINLSPYITDDCNFGDGMEYCTLLSSDEIDPFAYVQWRQTPCDGTLITDGNFNDLVQTWTADAGWSHVPNSQGDNLDDGSYFHTPGTSDDLSRSVPVINGEYYQSGIKVFGMTNGELTVTLAGVQLTFWKNGVEYDTITDNGEYILYGTMVSGSGDIVYHADTDFDGSVSYSSAYLLINDWGVDLVDMDEIEVSPQPFISINQQEDYVTASVQLSSLIDGCYKVRLNNSCANTFGDNVVPDNSFDFPLQWTHTNETGDDTGLNNLVMTGGAMVMTVDTPTRIVNEYLGRTVNGLSNGLYKLTMDFGNIDPNLIHGGGNVVSFKLGSISQPISMGAVPANTSYSVILNVTGLTGTADPVGIAFTRVDEGFCTGGEFIEVLGVTWRPVDPFYYVSNCISVKASHDCAKSITGVCDTNTKKLGFLWDGVFKLKHYLRFLFLNPYYPTEGKDYRYSSSIRSLTSASLEKYYEGLIDRIDETAHDSQRTVIRCDNFSIDGNEYFVKLEDYQPDWNKDGTQKLAQARIQLRLKDSTIYNNKI